MCGAALVINGTIYGTTFFGGSYCYKGSGARCGIAYSFDLATETETVLHSFGATGDGRGPVGLAKLNGLLYGLTEFGGNKCRHMYDGDCGTIFSLDPTTGDEVMLHALKYREGLGPENAPISVGGKIFATAAFGGKHLAGTVFSFDPTTNDVAVVNSFRSGGADPVSSLFNSANRLYGATYLGGYDTCFEGCGTVFEVTAK